MYSLKTQKARQFISEAGLPTWPKHGRDCESLLGQCRRCECPPSSLIGRQKLQMSSKLPCCCTSHMFDGGVTVRVSDVPSQLNLKQRLPGKREL